MSLILRGIDFGCICVSSGTLNFFGNGWPYHRLYQKIFGSYFDFKGATFIAKTTTLNERAGNMPLNEALMPKELKPKCIKVNFSKAIMLNAVGLSGPGAKVLLETGEWQKRTEPFMISFMSLGNTVSEQVAEAEAFVKLLLAYKSGFKAPFAVQVNGSCPNTKHSTEEVFKNSLAILEPFQKLGVPIDYKIAIADAIAAGIEAIFEIEKSGLCDCLTCSNTIPWGKLPELISWKELFGSEDSPLKDLGGGGLSGKPLKNIVHTWLTDMRKKGISMPIKAGGGILSPQDARDFLMAGANAVEIGCISTLRPYRIAKTIKAVSIYK